MKKITCLLSILLVTSLFTLSLAQGKYGAKIDESDAITMTELNSRMKGKEELNTKVTGTVTSVCRVKGCWMTIENPDGTPMRVTFKDYGFFVPKDISGKSVVVSGKAYMSTTTIEELKHYAEDAGKSEEEIAKITAPKRELAFEAEGVIVK